MLVGGRPAEFHGHLKIVGVRHAHAHWPIPKDRSRPAFGPFAYAAKLGAR